MKKNKRTTLRHEFVKKFIPIFILFSVLFIMCIFTLYKKVVQEAKQTFETTINSMQKELDAQFVEAIANTGIKLDENDLKDLEHKFIMIMYAYGFGDVPFIHNPSLVYDNNFSDFACTLYKDNSHTIILGDGSASYRYQEVDADQNLIYLIELGPSGQGMSYPRTIYTCNADAYQEAYDFDYAHRHAIKEHWPREGFVYLNTFYLNENNNTFLPQTLSLYKEKIVHEKGASYNEEIVEKQTTYDYDAQTLKNYILIDFTDASVSDKYYSEGRLFYGPVFFVGNNKNEDAYSVLSNMIQNSIQKFDTLQNEITSTTSNHGMTLEFTSYNALLLDPLDERFEDKFYNSLDNELFENHSQYVNRYVACTSATLNLFELYGMKVILCYLLVVLLGITISYFAAKNVYLKMKLQYDMIDYRKTLMDTMAHDLKTPLMCISGYAENLKENVYTEQKDEYADKIINRVEYVNQIIADVLQLSDLEQKKQNIELSEVNCNNMISQIFAQYEDLMEARSISYHMNGQWTTKADEKMMQRAFDNLISNAIKFCLDGCDIEINLDNGLEIKNNYDEKECTLDADELTKPFTKGNKSRTNQNGSGLGLALTNALLSQQGYTLSIDIKQGEFVAKVKKVKV